RSNGSPPSIRRFITAATSVTTIGLWPLACSKAGPTSSITILVTREPKILSSAASAAACPAASAHAKAAAVIPTRLMMPPRRQGDQNGAEPDQRNAKPIGAAQPLAEECRPENRDQHHAQLVDRRDLRGVAELEGAKIADPRAAGREPGEDQERVGLARDRSGRLELAGSREDQAQSCQDHGRADERGRIGIYVLHPHPSAHPHH